MPTISAEQAQYEMHQQTEKSLIDLGKKIAQIEADKITNLKKEEDMKQLVDKYKLFDSNERWKHIKHSTRDKLLIYINDLHVMIDNFNEAYALQHTNIESLRKELLEEKENLIYANDECNRHISDLDEAERAGNEYKKALTEAKNKIKILQDARDRYRVQYTQLTCWLMHGLQFGIVFIYTYYFLL